MQFWHKARINALSLVSPGGLNVLLFISGLILSLSFGSAHKRWHPFSDPYDYLKQSEYSWFSKDLYAPESHHDFDSRSLTIPVLYKIAGSKPDIIVVMQKFLHFLAAMALVFSLFLLVRRTFVRYLLLAGIYLLFSWWNFLGWSVLMLSESIISSLFFLWIASLIVLFFRQKPLWLVIHILVFALLSLTRDHWPYVLLPAYALLLGLFLVFDRKGYRPWLYLLIVSLGLFFAQNFMSKKGARYRVPVLNNIVYKVLPDSLATNWFINEGMPCSERLKAEFESGTFDKVKVYDMYLDSTYMELFDWIKREGRGAYMKYLLSHPKKLLLLETDSEQVKEIFAYNLFYTGSPMGYARYIGFFPLFGFTGVLILILISSILALIEREPAWHLPVFLLILFYGFAAILLNADSMETARHLYLVTIVMQFCGMLCVAIILSSGRIVKLFESFK